MCGEQYTKVLLPLWQTGSPPRVRGTVEATGSLTEGTRITPACAGNRKSRGNPAPAAGDHPRVCGEQYMRTGKASSGRGSPPRVRGM